MTFHQKLCNTITFHQLMFSKSLQYYDFSLKTLQYNDFSKTVQHNDFSGGICSPPRTLGRLHSTKGGVCHNDVILCDVMMLYA